jgi:hypothetical protein
MMRKTLRFLQRFVQPTIAQTRLRTRKEIKMARYTSSQGKFSWNMPADRAGDSQHPDWTDAGDKIDDTDLQQVQANADYIADNLETCFSEKSTHNATLNSAQKGTNQSSLYATNYDSRQSTRYDTNHATRHETNHATRYVTRHDAENTGYNGGRHSNRYNSDKWGWGKCSGVYSSVNSTYYADRHTGVYSNNNSAVHTSVNSTVNNSVYTSNYSNQRQSENTTRHSQVNGTN